MNVLFLTLFSFDSIQERTLYTDLLREFVKNGNQIYAISPAEKRQNVGTHLVKEENATILRLRIGNTQKTNIIEKGISTVMIEPAFKKAIKKYFSNVIFDLVLYSTPPITLVSTVEYVKKRDKAKTYLLLKDIFPQNAVDLGLMNKNGLKGLLYKYFRRQEERLYKISDRIGCMSEANVSYLENHNPRINPRIVEVCPNCFDVVDKSVDKNTRQQIREKYSIPQNKKIFVYGGNLGKPQGISFLIDCLKNCDNDAAFFLIVGDGTEYGLLETYVSNQKPQNVKLMKRLPKEDYDTMIGACDYGLIFLDHRFTIPNFPSRLLAYMQAKLPVIAVTDPNTDIGKVVVDGGFGWWCESNNHDNFVKLIDSIINQKDYDEMQRKEWIFLNKNYHVREAYKKIIISIGKTDEI